MTVVEKSWEVQKNVEERVKNIGKGKYGRVLRMTRKPSHDEYIGVIKITALGLILVGGLGFVIYLIIDFISGLF